MCPLPHVRPVRREVRKSQNTTGGNDETKAFTSLNPSSQQLGFPFSPPSGPQWPRPHRTDRFTRRSAPSRPSRHGETAREILGYQSLGSSLALLPILRWMTSIHIETGDAFPLRLALITACPAPPLAVETLCLACLACLALLARISCFLGSHGSLLLCSCVARAGS